LGKVIVPRLYLALGVRGGITGCHPEGYITANNINNKYADVFIKAANFGMVRDAV